MEGIQNRRWNQFKKMTPEHIYPDKHCVIGIPVLFRGGTEMQTLTLVQILMKSGIKVTILCYFRHDDDIVNLFQAPGCQVELMKLKQDLKYSVLIKKIKESLIRLKPDYFHVQYIAPGLLPIIAGKLSGVPKIFATVHQTGSTYGFKHKLFIHAAALLASKFIAVSKGVRNTWFHPLFRWIKKVHIIHNSVDISNLVNDISNTELERLRQKFNIPKNKFILGFAGRLRNEKGLHVLLRALPLLKIPKDQIHLIIAGDGDDLKELQFLADTLQISNRIQWVGFQPQSELFKLYRLIDVLVVPSKFEGFGLSAAEFMATGNPCIGSHIPGLREVILNEENGLLFEANNHKNLAQKINDLYETPELLHQYGKSAQQHIMNQFSLEAYSQKMKDIYQIK